MIIDFQRQRKIVLFCLHFLFHFDLNFLQLRHWNAKSIYFCLIQFKQLSFKVIFFVLHHLGFKDCRKIFIYQHGTIQVFLITKAFLPLLELIKSSFLLNLNLGPNSSWQWVFDSWSQRGNISFVMKPKSWMNYSLNKVN